MSLAAGHLVMLAGIYKALIICSLITPTDIYFLKQWDAYYYSSIAEHGYIYGGTEASNSGFFPLFAYVWKALVNLSGAGVEGICAFNAITFFTGLYILKDTYRFSWMTYLLLLSIPSMLFMFVPYSESLFFLFGACFLRGLKTNNRILAFTALLLASLTRPAALFFLPAVAISESLHFISWRKLLRNIVLYSSAPVIAIGIVVLMQYNATGEWFAYFKVQSQHLRRVFQLPEFPLTTWDGARILWLDAAGVFAGLLASGALAGAAIRRLRKSPAENSDVTVAYSLSFVVAALCSVLFFNSKDAAGGTSLMGANRYILATPFFAVAAQNFWKKFQLSPLHAAGVLIAALAVILSLNTGGYSFVTFTDHQKLVYLTLIFIYFSLHVLAATVFRERFTVMLYLLNTAIQLLLLHEFSFAKWIG